MNPESLFNELLHLAEKLQIEIRHLSLGGQGGGLCKIKGKYVLFLDINSEILEKLHQAAQELANLEQLDTLYIIPELRELLDRYRA